MTQWGWAWGQFLDHDLGLEQQAPRRDRAARVRPARPARGLSERSARRSTSGGRRPLAGTGETSAAAAPQRAVSSYIDASNVYGVDRVAARVAARRAARRRRPTTVHGCCLGRRLPPARGRARQRGGGAADGARRARSRPPREGRGRRRHPREREHRADRDPDAPGTRAQPAREPAARTSLPAETPLPDRAARRRGRGAVRHVPRVPSRAGRSTGAVPRLPPGREREACRTSSPSSATARHSMVNGDPRRDRAGRNLARSARSHRSRRRASPCEPHDGLVDARRSRSASRSATRTCSRRVGLGAVLEGLGAEREYRNDEQIDDAMRSILFMVPLPGTLDPSVCARQDDQPGLLQPHRGPRRRRPRARARPRDPVVQRAAARVRAAAPRRRSRTMTGESADTGGEPSTTGRCSTSSRFAMRTATRSRSADQVGRGDRASGGRRSPRGCKLCTAM